MLKVLFLIRSLDPGGAERQLVELAQNLPAYGISVVVATFYSGGVFREELINAGIRVISLNKQGRWDNLAFYLRFLQLVRQENPDIVHGYLPTANIFCMLAKPFFPGKRIVWGVRASNIDMRYYSRATALTYKLEALLAPFADLILANSYAGQDYWIQQGIPHKKMLVIPNGIDTKRFAPDQEARAQFRSTWQISGDTPLIGRVARLDPMKDHATFLHTATLIVQKHPAVKFICVGDGPERQSLQTLADQLGLSKQMLWVGMQQDMPTVYNALDILVSSSSFGEGFSNVIAEAMSCGIPCVVTDVGDSARIVGDTGVVVPARNPVALSEAVEVLLTRQEIEQIQISLATRARVINEFSIERLSRNTAEVLIELMTYN